MQNDGFFEISEVLKKTFFLINPDNFPNIRNILIIKITFNNEAWRKKIKKKTRCFEKKNAISENILTEKTKVDFRNDDILSQ
jgi:hypothetical protein